jgi:hypothetical protein
MILGIVGAEGAKFTPLGEQRAKAVIYERIRQLKPDKVVSGGCHLGGIDKWAIEIAKESFPGLFIATEEFLPKVHRWSDGYKPRNILIANNSMRLVNIVVDKLPENFPGMRHKLCYHCGTSDHVKSGGCWTMKYAEKIGKLVELVVIHNESTH